jgi:hypothetical protein
MANKIKGYLAVDGFGRLSKPGKKKICAIGIFCPIDGSAKTG